MLKRVFGFMALLAVGMQPALAVVYHWQDASGAKHFTDNPNQVPSQYRKNVVGGLIETGAPLAGENQEKSTARLPAKYKVWAEKCGSCHHADEGTKGTLQGLAHVTINKVSRFPATIGEVIGQLRFATNGRYSDMPRVDVSDEELSSIAQYLLSMQK
ncbi:MAG: DUF4124 domain-containing protein [Mariprofundaceae bacterium]